MEISGVGVDPKLMVCGLLSTTLLQPTFCGCQSKQPNIPKRSPMCKLSAHATKSVAQCGEIVHSVAANV